MTTEFFLLAGASAVAVAGIAVTALSMMRSARVRRHLRRLQTMPLEHGRD